MAAGGLRTGDARFAFDDFADYNTPRGKDAAGRDTRAESIARPLLKLDMSPHRQRDQEHR